jgi:hypothetical protein
VLAHMGTASGSCIPSCLTWVVLPAGPTIGRVYRSVAGSFKPTKIVLSLYFTTHFLLSNLTMHPASVRIRIQNREAMDNSGTMCPTRIVGRPGSTMSHICVHITWQPSANATLRGQVVFRLLRTGVPSITKICIAPESAIASLGAMVNTACRLDCIVGALAENTVWYVMDVPSETLDVTTVMSSSLMVMSLMGVYVKVGSNAVAITENGLHLRATSLLIAPNRHNCGKTVLWHFFVQHLYPPSMYCCALYHVKLTLWSCQRRCRGHIWLVWLSSTSKLHE